MAMVAFASPGAADVIRVPPQQMVLDPVRKYIVWDPPDHESTLLTTVEFIPALSVDQSPSVLLRLHLIVRRAEITG